MRRAGDGADRIELIPHGVEVFPDFIRPPRSPGPLRIVFLGRLEKRKGTLELLQAFPKVLELHPGTELTLIGTDRPHCPGDRTHAVWIQDELPTAVRQQIHLAGRLPQEQVNQHLKTADVFIAPSRYESFGLIYPEAMRWGIPVIGCNVGGVPEIIHDGESGLLIAPESPEAIIQALHRLLSDERLRQQLGTAGRKRVESEFSSMKMAERVVAKFEKLLATKGRRN
ncbi:MAG: glycosyltransferase family 4 protein [Gemmatales bacterium]